jgi:hypothetical protein
VNYNLYVLGRFCRNRMMNAMIIVPLLISALFAYQAGNTFELAAGTSRICNAARPACVIQNKQNAKQTHLWTFKVRSIVFVHSLVQQYKLPSLLSREFHTAVPQRLRAILMTPIKFTSHFVG